MATIRSLQVVLGAKTSIFTRKMREAGGVLNKFASGIGHLAKRLAQIGAVAVAAAAAGLTILIKKQMEAIDTMAKMSDRLGISTEDIARLGHVAEIMGVDQAALNKSLEMFVRRLGEARQGIGEAKDALTRLGLSADDLARMSPSDAIALISDRMRRLRTDADKAATAYQLFGRQGTQLLNMLKMSASEFRTMAAEADKLGLTLSRIDAGKVEVANDAITRMKKVFVGIGRTLAVEIAPFVERLVKMFNDWAMSGEGVGAKVTAAVRQIAKGLEIMLLNLVKVTQFIVKAGTEMAILHAGLLWGRAGKAAEEAAVGLSKAGSALYQMEWKLEHGGLVQWLDDVAASAAKAAQEAEKMRQAASKIGISTRFTEGIKGFLGGLGEGIGRGIDMVRGKLDELAQYAAKRRTDILQFAISTIESLKTPAEKLREELLRIADAQRFGFLSAGKAGEAAAAAYGRAMEEVKASQPAFADPGQFMALARGVSVAGLTMGTTDRVENKQLAELERIAASNERIAMAAQSGGMPY